MAVTTFNTTFTAGPTSVGARTLLHTGTAGASLLVWIHSNEATTYSAVAAGLRPLTRLTAISASTSRFELWGLSSVPAGVLTISAIPAGTQVATWAMAATTYTGQRQVGGSPFGTAVGGTSGATTTVNFSVSSTSTDLVAFGFGISANVSLTLNNGTTRATATHSTTGRMVIGDIAGDATVSLSATAGGSVVWGFLAVPIVASATPATTLAVDNIGSTVTSAAVGSIGLTLTATSGAVLLVFLNTDSGGPRTFSAVHVGVLQLTQLGAVNYSSGNRIAVWGLTAPPSGNLTISAELLDGLTAAINMGAITYTGQRTTDDPFGGVGTAGAAGATSITLSVSATAGNLVVVGIGSRMFDPISLSTDGGLTVHSLRANFPGLIVGDTIGAPAVTAVAQAPSAVAWGAVGIHLIQSGAAAFVSAIAAITEPQDTFAAPARTLIRGTAAATEALDTFAAPSRVLVRGTFAATEAPDKFSATARNTIHGTFAATEAPDTLVAAAQVKVRGTLAATEAADTFAATAAVRIRGTFTATEAPDTLAAPTAVRIHANFAATEAPDTLAATLTFAADFITGRLSATEAADTFVAPARVLVHANIAATEAQDTFVAAATAINANTTAVFFATEAPDTMAATGRLLIRGLIAATEAQDTFAAPTSVVQSADAVVPVAIDSGAGGGGRADDVFWELREKYLKSLLPHTGETIPQPGPTIVSRPPATGPLAVSPAFEGYYLERSNVIKALPLAGDMFTLRKLGRSLHRLNAKIARERELADMARGIDHERALREAERIQRRKLRKKALRKAKQAVASAALIQLSKYATQLRSR